jgi:hypothetical protein
MKKQPNTEKIAQEAQKATNGTMQEAEKKPTKNAKKVQVGTLKSKLMPKDKEIKAEPQVESTTETQAESITTEAKPETKEIITQLEATKSDKADKKPDSVKAKVETDLSQAKTRRKTLKVKLSEIEVEIEKFLTAKLSERKYLKTQLREAKEDYKRLEKELEKL